jgi:L-seryl-tRNA(Ser) seleniumtransferase
VVHAVFKTVSRRIKPAVAGSIPAPSAQLNHPTTELNRMPDKNQRLRNIPGLDKMLELEEVKQLLARYPSALIKSELRSILQSLRDENQSIDPTRIHQFIFDQLNSKIKDKSTGSFHRVINASGIIIHTNLGRAPFGDDLIEEVSTILRGYNNLEFNLSNGERGSRYDLVSKLLCEITGAEDVLIVNNNAAALLLILRAFGRKKEVIVSRGELIEIGGSFRLPSILAASDCKMVEVGTTNKTRIQDYLEAITPKTSLILKAHHSNFVIKGFTESVDFEEIAATAAKNELLSVFDLGSGLIDSSIHPYLKEEQDVRSAVRSGIDLICFSGDKLLGGPQAGIILGKKALISKLKKEQITRALRVDKITLALLEAVCKRYIRPDHQYPDLQLFHFIHRKPEKIKELAESLQKSLHELNIQTKLISSEGKFGGGTMPDASIPSYAVELVLDSCDNQKRKAEKIYRKLLVSEIPCLGLLIKGQLSFNLLSVFEDEIPQLAKNIATAISTT